MVAVWESESPLVAYGPEGWCLCEKEKVPPSAAKLSSASGALAGEQPHLTPWLVPLSSAQRVHLYVAALASKHGRMSFLLTQPGQSSKTKKRRRRGKR